MLERITGRVGDVTAGFSTSQKATMAAIFVAVVASIYVFSSWASTTDMAPLYTDLETADAATVTDELTTMGVNYDLADQGRTVLVPRDQVYSLRLDLSRTGALPGGTEGYSLLDEQGITSTQFQQRVAFQRALEGELAKTIRGMDAVDAATVHLVMPEDDLFSADDVHASASVLVQTAATLAPEQVQTIVNLVSGAVEGLRSDEVTVSDQNGLVLASPGQGPFDRAGANGALNQTRDFETQLAGEITSLLAAVVGPGKVMVTVSAVMDWDASSVVQETHTPSAVPEGTDPLKSSETTRTESYQTNSTDGVAEGVLGVGEEQNATPAESNSTYDANDRSTNFVFDSTIETTERQGGDITRLNVAVLLDEAAVTDAQLAEIQTLVTGAAGIDPARGDTLAVSRLAFDTTVADALATELENAGSGTAAGGTSTMSTMILGVLGLIIVLVGAIQIFRGGRKTDVEELDIVTLTNSLTAGSARPILPQPVVAETEAEGDEEEDEEEEEDLGLEPGVLSPEDELRVLVDSQPDEVARLLRTWLADRRAVSRA
ncbi:MAG: flagellar basal-body MS-ring/collar protein FliF [Actinomycetota bacterium]